MLLRWLVLALLLVGATATAQPFTPDRRLLLSEGILRGSPRLMGLAGSFVGIAEGAEGMIRNPAAVANKSPWFESDLNVDFGGTMHFLFPGAAAQQDWDNDGRPDQIGPAGGRFDFLGSQVIYTCASLQWKAIGIGAGFDLQNYLAKTPQEGMNLGLLHAFGSLGAAFWKDQLLLGVGIESTHAAFLYFENRALKDSLAYHGYGVQVGGLWRPYLEDYRLGFSFRPKTIGRPAAPRADIGGFIPFSDIVAPARLSLGGSWAVGGHGRAYNILTREEWAQTGTFEGGAPKYTPALTKWLLSAQLDVTFPVADATYAAAFLQQKTEDFAQPAGYRVAFEPRLAAEREVFPNHLRVRAGTYLEPALTDTGYLRPHLTLGTEIYLFRVGPQRLSFGLSFDFAHQYQNLSVAILVWK